MPPNTRRKIKKTVGTFNTFANADALMATLTQMGKWYPLKDVQVVMSPDDRYEIEFVTERPETDEEMAAREKAEKRAAILREHPELVD